VLQADSPYRPGTRSGWIKVKTERWKAANQYRVKLFDKRQQQNGGAPGRRRAIPGAHVRGYANRLQAATD